MVGRRARISRPKRPDRRIRGTPSEVDYPAGSVTHPGKKCRSILHIDRLGLKRKGVHPGVGATTADPRQRRVSVPSGRTRPQARRMVGRRARISRPKRPDRRIRGTPSEVDYPAGSVTHPGKKCRSILHIDRLGLKRKGVHPGVGATTADPRQRRVSVPSGRTRPQARRMVGRAFQFSPSPSASGSESVSGSLGLPMAQGGKGLDTDSDGDPDTEVFRPFFRELKSPAIPLMPFVVMHAVFPRERSIWAMTRTACLHSHAYALYIIGSPTAGRSRYHGTSRT